MQLVRTPGLRRRGADARVGRPERAERGRGRGPRSSSCRWGVDVRPARPPDAELAAALRARRRATSAVVAGPAAARGAPWPSPTFSGRAQRVRRGGPRGSPSTARRPSSTPRSRPRCCWPRAGAIRFDAPAARQPPRASRACGSARSKRRRLREASLLRDDQPRARCAETPKSTARAVCVPDHRSSPRAPRPLARRRGGRLRGRTRTSGGSIAARRVGRARATRTRSSSSPASTARTRDGVRFAGRMGRERGLPRAAAPSARVRAARPRARTTASRRCRRSPTAASS